MAAEKLGGRGRAIGSAVGAAIGGGWAIYAARTLAPGNAAALVLAVSIAAVLVVWGIATTRGVGGAGADPRASRARKLFLLNTIGEIVALNIMVYLLSSFDGLAYIIPGIAVVVGLHFLPMARFFDYPLFNWTGLLMIAAALAAVAFVHAGAIGSVEAGGFDSAVNALILWGTAAVGLLVLNRQRATGSIAR